MIAYEITFKRIPERNDEGTYMNVGLSLYRCGTFDTNEKKEDRTCFSSTFRPITQRNNYLINIPNVT